MSKTCCLGKTKSSASRDVTSACWLPLSLGFPLKLEARYGTAMLVQSEHASNDTVGLKLLHPVQTKIVWDSCTAKASSFLPRYSSKSTFMISFVQSKLMRFQYLTRKH
jgi:hypothetical protein